MAIGTTAKKKERRVLTDEERIRIALAKYEPLNKGKASRPTKTETLVSQFQRQKNTIIKAYIIARRQNVL